MPQFCLIEMDDVFGFVDRGKMEMVMEKTVCVPVSSFWSCTFIKLPKKELFTDTTNDEGTLVPL